MADSAFHLGGRGVKAASDAGIKLLGDTADKLGAEKDHADSFAQIVIALDVRGYADGEKHGRDFFVKRSRLWLNCELCGGGRALLHQVKHTPIDKLRLNGLKHHIADALGECALKQSFVAQTGCHNYDGGLVERLGGQRVEKVKSVKLGQYQLGDEDVEAFVAKLFKRRRAICGFLNADNIAIRRETLGKG